MPSQILTALLRGEHLNMEERADLGLLPHEVLDYGEVVGHLAAVISVCDWFPREFRPHVEGETVDERIVIERRGRHHFVCHAQRGWAIRPTVLAEEAHRRFLSARRAAKYFLTWEHHLPGDLDGWKVVRRRI
jgi:hypothetical protein